MARGRPALLQYGFVVPCLGENKIFLITTLLGRGLNISRKAMQQDGNKQRSPVSWPMPGRSNQCHTKYTKWLLLREGYSSPYNRQKLDFRSCLPITIFLLSSWLKLFGSEDKMYSLPWPLLFWTQGWDSSEAPATTAGTTDGCDKTSVTKTT